MYVELHFSSLKFDPGNPRLPSYIDGNNDIKVIEWMLGDASLAELMLAIGTNGYFPGEPLLVVEDASDGYLVIEGNRRLASLKLLHKQVEITKSKTKIEQVLNASKYSPSEIPCIVFRAREDIEKYLGFRHVTGIKEWSPLAKAKYLNGLLQNPLEDHISDSEAAELAKQIGSKRPYIKRLLVSFRVFQIIEENDFYQIPDLNETNLHFTYIMDSLNRPQIREFLGINLESDNPLKDLKASKSSNLENLMKWFFEKRSDTQKSVMNGESGTLAKFCEVLNDDNAFSFFETEGDLNSAYERTLDPADNYRTSVNRAIKYLEESITQLLHLPTAKATDLEKASKAVDFAKKLQADTSSKLGN